MSKFFKFIYYLLIPGLILSSLCLQINSAKATGVWSTGKAGGEARSEFASVSYDGKVYNWGGAAPAPSNKMDIYDIASDSWSMGLTGGTARWGNTAVVYNGKIYYLGGNDNFGVLDTVDIYNIAANSWSTGTAGGTPRMWHSSVVYNGKIYTWGGLDGALDPLDTLDIYNIATDSWSTGLAGGTARFSHSSVAYNGNIYSWGGADGFVFLNTLDIYNIVGDSWTTGTAGGTARWEFFSASLYRGKIYNWGGDDENGYLLNTMDIYDIGSDSWSTGTAGGTARKNYGSAIYNGKIYYFAGEKLLSLNPHLNTTTNTVDIYDTYEQPLPEFNNLPGSNQPINLEEGETITTDTYVIEVAPASEFGVAKVEFYVDDILICTDTQPDANGVYSCDWDTTRYHSDVKILVYDILGHTTVLTRRVIVLSDETSLPTALPETGTNLLPVLPLLYFQKAAGF